MHCSVAALTKHDLAWGLPDYVNEGSTLFAIPLSAYSLRHTFIGLPIWLYLAPCHGSIWLYPTIVQFVINCIKNH